MILIRKSSRQVSAILEFLFQRYLHLSVSYMVCTPGLITATDLMFDKKKKIRWSENGKHFDLWLQSLKKLPIITTLNFLVLL